MSCFVRLWNVTDRHLGIPQSHGLQGRETVYVLSGIRPRDPGQDCGERRARVRVHLERVQPCRVDETADDHLG